ncbi:MULTISPECIES: hypothetical protein [Streptomyces]|uniref:DUF3558 domain-containing protein n=1 Tax=Streptomyces mutomycini TaxID=284036 RepID=A0ABW0BC26_9ACTN|nr:MULTISPECIES: hypothetical protein [Streptomyces]KPC84206.1 hypothetical protein ADK82_05120 [Streptomyces sp. NRRL S-4]
MHRSAPRLSRILACAAVPVMLVVAGCSSDSDDAKSSGASASPSAKKSEPTVEAAKFASLPDACASIGKKTIEDLVPKTKNKGGTPGKSSDTTSRGGCSWNGLDDNGVKGSQYRWLDVGFTRFESDQSLGSGAKRATAEYTKQVAKAQATEDAKKLSAEPVTGLGEQATSVTYGLKKSDEDFEYATIVTRTENVVVTLTYNGAGFAGAKSPSAADILKGAKKAAEEAVSAVGGDGDKSSVSPSAKASSSSSSKESDTSSSGAGSSPSPKTGAKSSSKAVAKS